MSRFPSVVNESFLDSHITLFDITGSGVCEIDSLVESALEYELDDFVDSISDRDGFNWETQLEAITFYKDVNSRVISK